MATSFWRNRSGNVALIFGIAVIPLVLAVGVAVDYSRAAGVHDHLQDIADAAALAGAREHSDDLAHVTQVARAYFDAHVQPHDLQELDSFEVSFTSDGSVRVEARGKVATTFTAIAGIDTMDVDVSSEVVRGVEGSIEMALVLDNTGSMSGRKLSTLKKVSKKLVEDVAGTDGLDSKFGLVPFADYVNVGKSNVAAPWLDIEDDTGSGRGRAAPGRMASDGGGGKPGKPGKTSDWQGCVGSRAYPLNIRDESYDDKIPAVSGSGVTCPSSAIQPLTDDADTVQSALRGMKANGCTYIPGRPRVGLARPLAEVALHAGRPLRRREPRAAQDHRPAHRRREHAAAGAAVPRLRQEVRPALHRRLEVERLSERSLPEREGREHRALHGRVRGDEHRDQEHPAELREQHLALLRRRRRRRAGGGLPGDDGVVHGPAHLEIAPAGAGGPAAREASSSRRHPRVIKPT